MIGVGRQMITVEQKSARRGGPQIEKGLGMYLVCMVLFIAWAVTVSHIYALGSTLELLAAAAIVLILMRILSGKPARRLTR